MNSFIFSLAFVFILVVGPILIFYHTSNLPNGKRKILVITMPFIWFIFNTPIHELSHALGSILVGGSVEKIKFYSNFLGSESSYAFTQFSEEFSGFRGNLITVMPYIVDLVLFLVGYITIKDRIKDSTIFTALILVLLLLRSSFNTITNLSLTLLFGFGDFYQLKQNVGFIAILPVVCMAVFYIYVIVKLLYKRLQLLKSYGNSE